MLPLLGFRSQNPTISTDFFSTLLGHFPTFEDLPFAERPDLTPYIIHLTKNTTQEDDFIGFANLSSILRTGRINASSKNKGFIKGPRSATCFMDIPFAPLKYLLNEQNSSRANPRYEPYGVFITKKLAYKNGCRPVLYLSDIECRRLCIPQVEIWRVVRFEQKQAGWISWLHEREWRCKGAFRLPKTPLGVLVRTAKEAKRPAEETADEPDEFSVKPQSIIPLNIICQGASSILVMGWLT